MFWKTVTKFPTPYRPIFQNGRNKCVINKIYRRNKSIQPVMGGAYDINYRMKSVRVCILGGCTPTGKILASLLAQNPLIYGLNLHGGPMTVEIAHDLDELDTRCIVRGYQASSGLLKAILGSDIILALGVSEEAKSHCCNDDQIFEAEAKRIATVARICSLHAPKTYFVVCAHPVSMLLPMCVEIYKPSHMYNPGRVLGSSALVQVRVNSILANLLELSPASVHVPLCGGPEIRNVVPLFTRATPYPLGEQEAATLTRRLYGVDHDMDNILIRRAKTINSTIYSEAVAIARLTTIIAESLCGDANAISSVFMRTNAFGECVKFLTTSVKFAPGGVTRNYGIPQLNKTELGFLEKSIISLEKNECRGLEALEEMEFKKDPADYFNVPCCDFHEEYRL